MTEIKTKSFSRSLLKGTVLNSVTFLLCFVPMVISAQNRYVVAKTDSSITFVVDRDLPEPKIKFRTTNLSEEIASELNAVATSFDGEMLHRVGTDVLFQFFVEAYIDHRPIVLSPDVIWITICQGFSRYINAHSEQLRSMIVDHQGKKQLVVETEALDLHNADWTKIIDSFSEQIRQNTKTEIAETVTADFSTTGITERIASEITLMDCMKDFFEYELWIVGCGIPTVTLKGTPNDWQRVLEKTRQLSQYGLEKWVKKLEPILTEFIKASNGKPDNYFWRCMVNYADVDTLNSPGCNPHGEPPDFIDGWFLRLFPDKNGKVKQQIRWTSKSEQNQVSVPFICKIFDNNGNMRNKLSMEFIAGIVGIKIDSETGAFTPRIGWIVRQK